MRTLRKLILGETRILPAGVAILLGAFDTFETRDVVEAKSLLEELG